jgi:hypothetical protein
MMLFQQTKKEMPATCQGRASARIIGGRIAVKSSRAEQRQQTATAIQRHQIVATAHMRGADEDLWHGTATGDLHHFFALARQHVNADFIELNNTALLQKRFGLNAIRA